MINEMLGFREVAEKGVLRVNERRKYRILAGVYAHFPARRSAWTFTR